MAEIGFYHLTRARLEDALPRLLEKAVGAGHRVVVLTGSLERMRMLNGVLWTYQQRSWLPHGSAEDPHAERQPIFLTVDEINPNGADVMAVVDGQTPSRLDGYARVLDLFEGANDEAVAAARRRWTMYRDAGHKLTYWQQTDRGGWEAKAEA